MTITFTLTPEQQQLQQFARSFADVHLRTAHAVYTAPHITTTQAAFNSIRPVVSTAVAAGLVSAQIPSALGGTAGDSPLLDAAILVEEFFVHDSSVPIAILSASLGLAPVIMAGTKEQRKELLAPFLTKSGEPLACLGFSEKGGSANYILNPALTTAIVSPDGKEFVINGGKLWASNLGGWDYRGADVISLVCRVLPRVNAPIATGPQNIAIIAITRGDIAANEESAFTAVDQEDTLGFNAVSGPAVTFMNLRVPRERLIGSVGQGPELVSKAFTGSAAMVGAMACGIMRAAFEDALAFAKREACGGTHPVIHHQSVADRLIEMKMRLETARLLTWKAASAFDASQGQDAEGCWMAKVYASEAATEVVQLGMAVLGMESYSLRQRFPRLLRDAACLPIFDGGNVGVRRRELQNLFEGEAYDPLAFAYGGQSEA